MASPRTQAFIAHLQELEATGNAEPLVQLFADDAELESPNRADHVRGRAGARAFWREYRGVFGRVHSEFLRVREHGDEATLEWCSQGTLAATGTPLEYRGVSLLEFAGDRLRRFATYYDSAAFLPGGSKHTPAAHARPEAA